MTEEQSIATTKTQVRLHKKNSPDLPLVLVQYPNRETYEAAHPHRDVDFTDHLLAIDVAREYADEIGVGYEIVRA